MEPLGDMGATAREQIGEVVSDRDERLPGLDGGLAAALERVARVAATSLGVPSAAILLLGEDRRCFTGGSDVPAWLLHDSGALFRSGVVARIREAGGPMSIGDARADTGSDGLPLNPATVRELGIGALLGTTLGGTPGAPVALMLAFDGTPRSWSEAELRHFTEIAASALTEIELQRRTVEAARFERQLRHDALHDALTGLPNRVCFVERLRHAVERARRTRGPAANFAVLFVDLDNFKAVNDSLGHLAGDELLAEVARRLASCLRGADTLARLGGDEFALLLEELGEPSDAARVAERLQVALRDPMAVGDAEVFTSASIGIALADRADDPPQHLLRSADLALYRAKEHGRARFEMFDPRMHTRAVERLRLETDLRRALQRDQLVLHYQPVVSLVTGSILASEALLRWEHPVRGTVAPVEFIPIAERTGLILDIGRWVLARACSQLQAWEKLFGYDAPQSVWVNISAKQFGQSDLPRQVADALDEISFDPRRVKLEITESIVLEDVAGAIRMLGELRELGIQVFMDDFGTGYSSLAYLGRLPLDGIKVDRSFVGQMDSDPRQVQLVRTMVTLIRNLGLEPIAEGVETSRQAELLREMGCTFAQGFAFSRAVPPRDLEQLLASRAG